MRNRSPLPTLLSFSRQMRNNSASTCCTNTSKADDGKKKTLSEANYKLRKAKSLVNHSPFIISAIWLWPPCLNHSEIINGDKSLETVHPAGIMHYGTAFAQREANYADDGGKGGGEGEIEDTAASNIQALVELLYIYLSSGFALNNIPQLLCYCHISSFRCSSAPAADPTVFLMVRHKLTPHGHRAVSLITPPLGSLLSAFSTYPSGTPGSVRSQRGRRCLGWVWKRSGRSSVHTGAFPVSFHSSCCSSGLSMM